MTGDSLFRTMKRRLCLKEKRKDGGSMKHRISAIIMCILVGVILTACSLGSKETEKKLPELKIGGAVYEPYFYKDSEGHYTGIDVELAREACARLGYRPVFKEIDLGQRKKLLRTGKIDCMWSCFSIDDNKEGYLWAGPYLYSRRVVVVRGDSDVMSLSDLKDKSIAVQSNSTSEKLFLDNANHQIPRVSRIASYRTFGEVFTALRKGYVDAIAGHEGALLVYTQDYPGQYRYLNMTLHQAKLGVAFDKNGDQKLAGRLTAVLKKMSEDGTTGSIIEKYGLDVDKNIYGGAD